MKGPYGFEVNDSCQRCKLCRNGFFCALPESALKDFDALKFVSAYPQETALFVENQASRGLYVLCEGDVKLSISSSEGKTMILRIAEPGEVLGLAGTLADKPHEVSAETLCPCQVAFVPGDAFLRFLEQHPEAYPLVAKQLASDYQNACKQLRTVGLCTSASGRLAKLLLDLSAGCRETERGIRLKFPLTHEEIGEFIGTTRETVTRTLSEFKSQNLVMIRASTLLIQDRAALERIAALPIAAPSGQLASPDKR